jgi:predicted metal-dependent hydrolase
MKQGELFGGVLKMLVPKRRPKLAPRLLVTKPRAAGPQSVGVELAGENFTVHIFRKKQARHFTLALARDGTSLRLTLPVRASVVTGLDFVREKQALVLKWLAVRDTALQVAPGCRIPFRGVAHDIVWQADFPRGVERAGTDIRVGGAPDLAGARVRRWLKKQALDDLMHTTQAVALRHQVRVTKIAVNNARARWGSCSSGGSINYSWRLICAPDAARHYVVCHELAHLKHMNHSPQFWAEVARLGGDLSQRVWFKTDGQKVLAL